MLLVLSRTPVPTMKEWHKFALVGATGVTAYNLALNYGSQFIQSGSAAFLVNTAPILTMIFSVIMLKERVHYLAQKEPPDRGAPLAQ